jgi:hypothetical protein
LYYTSENYRSFLQNIKEDDILKEVNDDYVIESQDENIKFEEELNKDIELNQKVESNLDLKIEKIHIKEKDNDNIKMSLYSSEILKKFYKYNLVELKLHSNLMDVTNEYPDEYFEYYNSNFTLLFFPTKSYNDVKEIFEIESD